VLPQVFSGSSFTSWHCICHAATHLALSESRVVTLVGRFLQHCQPNTIIYSDDLVLLFAVFAQPVSAMISSSRACDESPARRSGV